MVAALSEPQRVEAPSGNPPLPLDSGLRYVSDVMPGIRRRRRGKHFQYVGPDGATIRDPKQLQRIRALAVPPAWTDVWICPTARGHIQATGRDAKGRKQYRYHTRYRAERDTAKYDRLATFARALPAIRERVGADLALPGLPRDRVLAAVVALLDASLIRVGNEAYVRQNGSFGLTTLRNRHAKVSGSEIRFRFVGKSGKEHVITLRDRRLARLVQRCQELPGQVLFQYVDELGELRAVESGDVNAYLREITGEPITAKDFRTWGGTVLAAQELDACEPCAEAPAIKRNVLQAIDTVAARLGNTRAVCRACYVHPAVIDAYERGETLSTIGEPPAPEDASDGLTPEEALVVALLRRTQGAARA
jgi:DNA topoisomerase-1